MRGREKAAGTEVDWAVEAVMKACALEGKRESLATDIALRLLDLEVGVLGLLFTDLNRQHHAAPARPRGGGPCSSGCALLGWHTELSEVGWMLNCGE